MRAITISEPRKLIEIETAEPAAPGPGEVLVRPRSMGVCGTDISAYLGKFPFFEFPRIPGHELGVEVLEVGADVSHLKPGDRCSVEPYMHCGNCRACKKGKTNCCENLRVIGVMCDGGLCERLLLPAEKLHLGNSLTLDQLALVETLAVGRHAVQRSGCGPADQVLIVGAGPIGLSVLEFVKLSGARPIVLDVNENRLDFCRRQMQAADTLTFSENFPDQLRELTGGDLADVVFEATGNRDSMSAAFHRIAPAGKIVFVGITTEPITFSHPPLHKLEATLLCSRNALESDFTQIIELIAGGDIDTKPWITHRLSFEELPRQFDSLFDPAAGVVKAMVDVT